MTTPVTSTASWGQPSTSGYTASTRREACTTQRSNNWLLLFAFLDEFDHSTFKHLKKIWKITCFLTANGIFHFILNPSFILPTFRHIFNLIALILFLLVTLAILVVSISQYFQCNVMDWGVKSILKLENEIRIFPGVSSSQRSQGATGSENKERRETSRRSDVMSDVLFIIEERF